MSYDAGRVIRMPPTESDPKGQDLPLRGRSLVVVGANGCGKTRFGAWLESQDSKRHHRVSAHRSLTFPDRVQPTDIKDAERHLFYGTVSSGENFAERQIHRWRRNPAIALLDDYGPLLTLVVSESFAVSDEYRVRMQNQTTYAPPPRTRLDAVKSIWEHALPLRELVITGSRIEARNRSGGQAYHAKEMSDGERGVFYLIGEALSVPKDGTFIVDEPELHIHRAIQARLWDALEAERPDCTFVYITHDLGFAATRKDATKVWLRDYADEKWRWEIVPENPDLPEGLVMEVLGSRHPVLFVEGTQDSLDVFLYGRVFPGRTVVPCGGCEAVIHATKSFEALKHLHDHDCIGLVDFDGRFAEGVQRIEGLGVSVLPVAIVENLLLAEPVVLQAAHALGRDGVDTLNAVRGKVFELVERNRDLIVSKLARQEVEGLLRAFGGAGGDEDLFVRTFEEAVGAIDPGRIYRRWSEEIASVVNRHDYPAALKYYCLKGLVAETGPIFGCRMEDQMVRWFKSPGAAPFLQAVREALRASSSGKLAALLQAG